VFFLDPALEQDETMRHVAAVTLSYTFFASKNSPAKAADKSADNRTRPGT
jgi:cytochrome c oxidase assembly protein subunit 11